MSDLHTKYMGLTLKSPLVASAGPIQQKVDGVKALADAVAYRKVVNDRAWKKIQGTVTLVGESALTYVESTLYRRKDELENPKEWAEERSKPYGVLFERLSKIRDQILG